jgi:hypothetical protein
MGKIVLFLALAVIAWMLFKGLSKKPGRGENDVSANSPEKMVKCDQCGVFMPESESVQLDDKRTCRTPTQCLRRQKS